MGVKRVLVEQGSGLRSGVPRLVIVAIAAIRRVVVTRRRELALLLRRSRDSVGDVRLSAAAQSSPGSSFEKILPSSRKRMRPSPGEVLTRAGSVTFQESMLRSS